MLYSRTIERLAAVWPNKMSADGYGLQYRCSVLQFAYGFDSGSVYKYTVAKLSTISLDLRIPHRV